MFCAKLQCYFGEKKKKRKLKKEETTELPLSFCFPQSALVLIFIDIIKDNNIIQVWMLEWKGKIQLKIN